MTPTSASTLCPRPPRSSACEGHPRCASSFCQNVQTRAEFAAPCTRMSGDNASPPTKRLCTRRIGIRERRVETESDMGRYSRTRFEPNAGLNDNRRADCPTGQPPPSVWHSRRWEIGESSDGPWDRGDVGSGCSGLAHPGKRMCSADVPAAGWGGENRDRSVGRRHRSARSRDRSSACREPEGCRFCPREGPTPRPGTPEGPPVLDLTSLEKRRRETQAIGVFTKLALKNQVDDLLEQLAAFHEGRGQTPFAKLWESLRSSAPQGVVTPAGQGPSARSGHRRIARSALESAGGSCEVCKPLIPLGRKR